MKAIFLLVLPLIFYGCSSDEPQLRPYGFDIPFIRGYYLTDISGTLLGVVGQPNVNNEDLTIYPNPSDDVCYVRTNGTSSELWVVPAVYEGENANSADYFGAKNMYAGNAPVIHAESKIATYRLEVSNLNEGFYRIYVKIGDEIFYNNLVVDHQYSDGL